VRIAFIGALILFTAGGYALAQTSAPSSTPSSPATALQTAPGAPPSGGPALVPTPGTPSPGGVVQSPSPATNSTPSQTNVDLFPPSRLTTPGAPAGAPSSNQSPSQPLPLPGQLGQNPQNASRPQPGGANSSAPAANPSKTGNDYNLTECVKLWDAGTHMSKGEWRAACKRVQDRLNNLEVIAVETNQKGSKRQSKLGANRGSPN